MIRLFLACLLLSTVTVAELSTPQATSSSLDGIYALVERRAPAHTQSFNFELIEGEGDAYELADSATGIQVKCTTVSACARGFYHYVTEYGNVDIWWTGSRLDKLPSELPKVGTAVQGNAIVPWRYHFNTVTFSYTAAFWDFEQWELELDWLALRGVNLPLAWIGYEYILVEVFQEVGLSDSDITSFLSGPAFQAWNRFGNIHGSWNGDLPTQWISDQFELQKQVLQRMTSLGMTPVLPSFPGFVPNSFATLYPDAAVVSGGAWEAFPPNYTDTTFLQPFDPLFAQMQKSFISKQQAAYGKDVSHIYTLDQYNENNPFSGSDSYLANISSSTFASLRAADSEAIWMLQGWLFFSSETFWTNDRISAFLNAVPGNDSMLILDLYSEAAPQWQRTESYYGKDWIWCELHGYGGNMGIEGNLPVLVTDPLQALSASPSMKGMGLTMEGQEGNELVYDILLDQAWSSTSLDITSYVEKWVARRYPVDSLPSTAQQAWATLSTTVYSNNDTNTQATIKSIFELSPSLTGLVNRTGHHPTEVPYDTDTTIVPALKDLVAAGLANPQLLAVPEFLNDVVDVSRQLIANKFIGRYTALIAEYTSTNATPSSIRTTGQPLLEMLSDLDKLLSTNDNFLLSTWISNARSLAGSDSAYADFLEYNARNQITLWGPTGQINDYASKQWAGLVGTYYLSRWEYFVDYLANTKSGTITYNATALAADLLDIGEKWDLEVSSYQTPNASPPVDLLSIVDEILTEWV